MKKTMELPEIFRDGMVLQREAPVPIFGRDIKGQSIILSLGGHRLETLTDSQGDWCIILPQQAPGGPITMTIEGSDTIQLKDLWFGDVFLLSGQSNMELPLARVMDLYGKEIGEDVSRGDMGIRQFTMEKEGSFDPRSPMDIKGSWQRMSAHSLDDFSAVGWFFAKAYQERHGQVPLGLIQTAVGGSPLEAWCSQGLLAPIKESVKERLGFLRDPSYIKETMIREGAANDLWLQVLLEKDGRDHLTQGREEDWHQDQWIDLPAMFSDYEDLAGFSGLIWLRKTFVLEEDDLEDMNLRLGTLIDRDEVWVNGHWVGRTDYQYPPRNYRVSGECLQAGINTVVLRMIVDHGQGGFHRGKPYHLISQNKKRRINLRGKWQYLAGEPALPVPDTTFFNWEPTALYNGMLHPLKDTVIKAMLWYQGESNVLQEADDPIYETLFKGFISEVRTLLGHEDMPVVGTLLAGFDVNRSKIPGTTADFRQIQLRATEVPGVGMVSAADLGEYNDIHPLRKKALGERLEKGLHVLMTEGAYRYPGPKLAGWASVDGGYQLSFTSFEGKLIHRKPSHFQLLVTEKGSQDDPIWLEVKGQWLDDYRVLITKADPYGQIHAIAYGHLDWSPKMGLYDEGYMPVMPFIIPLKE